MIGPRAVRLFPIYHPAAALYTRSLLDDAPGRLRAPPGAAGARPAAAARAAGAGADRRGARAGGGDRGGAGAEPEPEPSESQLGLF